MQSHSDSQSQVCDKLSQLMLRQRLKVKVVPRHPVCWAAGAHIARIQPQLNGEQVLSVGPSWLPVLPSMTMISSELIENVCHFFSPARSDVKPGGRHSEHGLWYVSMHAVAATVSPQQGLAVVSAAGRADVRYMAHKCL